MIEIKDIKIGENQPVFIVAEAGINAGDKIDVAKQLVDIAVETKCDAVKFQTFKPVKEDFPDVTIEFFNKYRKFPNLSYEEFVEIKKYCDKKKIIIFSTPHSLSAVDFLAPLVPVYKIASPSITNDYFVRRVKSKGKPIIASTGSISHQTKRATEEEVDHFLSIANNHNLALLYCVSEYPCYNFDEEEFNDFKERYNGYPIGFSCHSKNINYSLRAVQLGACIVEQHITIADDFPCPDKRVSLNPYELEQLVNGIRSIEEGNEK